MNSERKMPRRTVSMTDFMWETLADLAASNGRTIGEEIRQSCEMTLKLAGYDFDEERSARTVAEGNGFRQVDAA